MNSNRRQRSLPFILFALVFGIGTDLPVVASAADSSAPPGRTIGYVITDFDWGIYETKDAKEECPDGLSTLGPREQFKKQFPDDGTKRSLNETQLLRESEIWWPQAAPDRFPMPAGGGKIAIGLNLDGKTKPTDFTSPDGTPGIDNQMARALGCISNYREGSSVRNFYTIYFRKLQINRMLIVLSDVDSLENDDDVTITTYRGLDPMVTDATGNSFVPGGTQRLDTRWGKEFIHHAKAKIVNGTLKTEPLDFYWPHEHAFLDSAYYLIRDARFELKLTAAKAEGLLGGYADVDHLYFSAIRTLSTHHLSYGQEAQTSLYKSLQRMADAYPDPKTGLNKGISSGFVVKLVQVRILPNANPKFEKVAMNKSQPIDSSGGTTK